jgi:hypothetical protein
MREETYDRFPRVVAKQSAAKAVASNAGRAARARLGKSGASQRHRHPVDYAAARSGPAAPSNNGSICAARSEPVPAGIERSWAMSVLLSDHALRTQDEGVGSRGQTL